jgi:hypothetical protein
MPPRRRDRPKHLRRRDAVINDTSEVAAGRRCAQNATRRERFGLQLRWETRVFPGAR